jgi:hypothetical protein
VRQAPHQHAQGFLEPFRPNFGQCNK